MDENKLSHIILGCAIEVHKKLGDEGALKKVAEITFKVASEKSPNLKLLK